jgi:6-pyruvoyltetrahydropterin/6-carboxytetrahydropterin synthase
LSNEQNFALYGKCSNPNGHGHNYDLIVEVAGEINPSTGMVVNFYELNEAIDEHIFRKVDHKNLNTDVPFMNGVIPTAENMAQRFWEQLEPHLKGCRLHSITINERDTNVVSYYGPAVKNLTELRDAIAGAADAAGRVEGVKP